MGASEPDAESTPKYLSQALQKRINDTKTLIQILDEMWTNAYDGYASQTLAKIKAGNDQALKAYLSPARINAMKHTLGMDAIIDKYETALELLNRDDTGIAAWEIEYEKFMDDYEKEMSAVCLENYPDLDAAPALGEASSTAVIGMLTAPETLNTNQDFDHATSYLQRNDIKAVATDALSYGKRSFLDFIGQSEVVEAANEETVALRPAATQLR